MAAFGRILQIVGWFWVVGGFLAPMAGYERINILPGLILIFGARAIRRQAASRQEPDEEPAIDAEEAPQRILNTERVPRPAPPPEPAVRYRAAEEQAADELDHIFLEPDNLIERITSATGDRDREPDPVVSSAMTGDQPPDTRLSSAEMIARAHERWDRKG
jgi:hypothetical protein